MAGIGNISKHCSIAIYYSWHSLLMALAQLLCLHHPCDEALHQGEGVVRGKIK